MMKSMQTSPWHSVNIGEDVPSIVNAIIEIPKGSKAKYELDKPSGLLRLDRVLFSAVHYPANYGFIPQTFCDDGDPLDILVICSIDVVPMCIVEAKVIGVMRMLDEEEYDDKIIAVALRDPGVNYITTLDEVPQHFFTVLKNYFEQYKVLENKKVEINDFQEKETAFDIINESVRFYKETYPK